MQITDMMGQHDAETQALIGFVVVWIVEKLKRVGWFPWLTQNTAGINRTINLISSALIGGGFAYSHQLTDTGQTAILLVLPTVSMAVHSFYQVLAHEIMYNSMFRGKIAPLGTGTFKAVSLP